MKTYASRSLAESEMIRQNKQRINRNNFELVVIVEGPGADEVTLMDLKDALDNGFAYQWAAL